MRQFIQIALNLTSEKSTSNEKDSKNRRQDSDDKAGSKEVLRQEVRGKEVRNQEAGSQERHVHRAR
jgi:hypothetical protein